MNSEYNTHPMHDQISKELCDLFEKYVPAAGPCETVGGEIVRAMNKVLYRWENDGDKAGEGYGRETVNPAVRYLHEQLEKYGYEMKLMNGVESHGWWSWDDKYDTIAYNDAQTVLNMLEKYPELFETENDDDYLDYRTADDVDNDYDEEKDDYDYWEDDEED